MKWIAISGSRVINREIENKVRFVVRNFINRGDGLVSGGAPGVDQIALDEALKINPSAQKIKIFIPTTLNAYIKHYKSLVLKRKIKNGEVQFLIAQLTQLKSINGNALIENMKSEVSQETYHERNGYIVDAADELIAFQVNESSGTQNTVEKAKNKGIPVQLFTYSLPQKSIIVK